MKKLLNVVKNITINNQNQINPNQNKGGGLSERENNTDNRSWKWNAYTY